MTVCRLCCMVGSIIFRVETNDKMAIYHLLGPDNEGIKKGQSNQISENSEIILDKSEIRKDIGTQTFEFILQIGVGASSGVIGNYIYDRLKDSEITSLQIGGEEVEIEEDSIQEKLDKYADD